MIQYILLFIFIYHILNKLSLFGIYGVPGSNQINLLHLFRYYLSSFKNEINKSTLYLKQNSQGHFSYDPTQKSIKKTLEIHISS